MKILLLFPPNVDSVEPFKSAPQKPPRLMWGFPLGLGYLAAVLRHEGFTVSILDACFDNLPLDEIISEIKKNKPEVVGIGSLTHILKSSLELAKRIKGIDRGIKIVFGGPHATYDYKNLLKFDFIDYVVLGEGENTFLELCRKLEDGASVVEVKGLVFHENREALKNEYRSLINNLDELPLPARDMVDFNKYIKTYGVLEKSVDVMSSRGCTNVCAFCSSAHLFGRWRTRTPENIISEIKLLVKKYPAIRSINFMDDNFTADKARVLKLSRLLVSEGLNKYNWVCLARVDQLDEEMVSVMKSAGCLRVHLGIESGSPQILRNINKRISLEQAEKTVSLLKSAKIEAYSFFMVGHPGETQETIRLTRKFARKLKSSNTGIFIAQIYPGTKLEQLQPVKNWAEYVYTPEIEHPSIFTHPCVPCFIPDGFSREKLKKICAEITREFIFLHFFRRFHLFVKKFFTEPMATTEYIVDVFFKK